MDYKTGFYNCCLIVRLVSKIKKNNFHALLPGSPFSYSLMWVGKKWSLDTQLVLSSQNEGT